MKNFKQILSIQNSVARIEVFAKEEPPHFFFEYIKDYLKAWERGDYETELHLSNLSKWKVGHRLGHFRKLRFLTQHQLSVLSGVRQPEISRYESHFLLPSVATCKKLSKALKCDYRLLL